VVVEDEEDYLPPMSREEEEAFRYVANVCRGERSISPQIGRGAISLILFLVFLFSSSSSSSMPIDDPEIKQAEDVIRKEADERKRKYEREEAVIMYEEKLKLAKLAKGRTSKEEMLVT